MRRSTTAVFGLSGTGPHGRYYSAHARPAYFHSRVSVFHLRMEDLWSGTRTAQRRSRSEVYTRSTGPWRSFAAGEGRSHCRSLAERLGSRPRRRIALKHRRQPYKRAEPALRAPRGGRGTRFGAVLETCPLRHRTRPPRGDGSCMTPPDGRTKDGGPALGLPRGARERGLQVVVETLYPPHRTATATTETSPLSHASRSRRRHKQQSSGCSERRVGEHCGSPPSRPNWHDWAVLTGLLDRHSRRIAVLVRAVASPVVEDFAGRGPKRHPV